MMACTDTPRRAAISAARQCAFCGAAIRFPRPLPDSGLDRVCESAQCRALVMRQTTVSATAFAHLVRIRARQAREQKERELAADRRLRMQKDAEGAVNETLWQLLARQCHASAGEYAQLLLPSGPRRLANLSQRRRNRYRDHLDRIISEAARDPKRDEPRPAASAHSMQEAESGIESRLCATCGGGCCTRGGESAYLTADTIRRYMREHPRARPGEVLAAYLDRVANRTEAGSCVNHGASGCTLPRDMRSDVCNNYLCSALKDWQQRSRHEPKPRGALVIVRRQDNWMRDTAAESNAVVATASITVPRR